MQGSTWFPWHATRRPAGYHSGVAVGFDCCTRYPSTQADMCARERKRGTVDHGSVAAPAKRQLPVTRSNAMCA